MAGSKVNNYSQVDSNILELQLTSDQNFKGKHLVSLTNYDTTGLPAIAAGSNIEINGGFYKFASEEAISTTDPVTATTVADGTVYIMINPTTVTAYFTATAPTWSDSKQGFYGLTTWANWRYLEYMMYKATSDYFYKRRIVHDDWIDRCDFTRSDMGVTNITSLDSYNIHSTSTGTLELFRVDTSLPGNGSATYNFEVFKPCRIWIELDSNRSSGAGTDTATAVLSHYFGAYTTGHTLASVTVTTTAGLTRDQKAIIYDLGVGYTKLVVTHTPGGAGSFLKRAWIISVANEKSDPVLNKAISIL